MACRLGERRRASLITVHGERNALSGNISAGQTLVIESTNSENAKETVATSWELSMTLLLIAAVWTTLISLVVALCVIARLGDRDRAIASLTSTPGRREHRTLLARLVQSSREHVRRRQRITA